MFRGQLAVGVNEGGFIVCYIAQNAPLNGWYKECNTLQQLRWYVPVLLKYTSLDLRFKVQFVANMQTKSKIQGSPGEPQTCCGHNDADL